MADGRVAQGRELDTSDARPGRTVGAVEFTTRGTGALLAACAAVATASLALPAVIGYDPWAWLVWGRELTRGELSTEGGPAWKPLPVLVNTLLAPFGGAAPELWLLVARTGGLFGLVLAYRLAARFAGPALAGVIAGVVAVGALLLTPDGEARWIRHVLQGNVEPLLIALCLWAVERHLDGRRGQALLLAGAAALLRPEVWPFLALYAAYLLLREPSRWRLVVPVVLAVPVLWFGGDWVASGHPLTGADKAQVIEAEPTSQLLATAWEAISGMVIVPVWVAAAVGVAVAVRRGQRAPLVLAAAAVAWMGVVAAMTTVLGYAALSRFLEPAAAVLCVLAGIAVAAAVTVPRPVALRVGVAAVLVAAVWPFAVPRAQWLPAQLAFAAERGGLHADLDRAIDLAGGRDGVLACGAVAIDSAPPAIEARPALSWKLDLPLAEARYALDGLPGVELALTGGVVDGVLAAVPDARPIARTTGWTVYAVRCPAAAG